MKYQPKFYTFLDTITTLVLKYPLLLTGNILFSSNNLSLSFLKTSNSSYMLSLSDTESGDHNVTVEVGGENSGKAGNDKELGCCSS